MPQSTVPCAFPDDQDMVAARPWAYAAFTQHEHAPSISKPFREALSVPSDYEDYDSQDLDMQAFAKRDEALDEKVVEGFSNRPFFEAQMLFAEQEEQKLSERVERHRQSAGIQECEIWKASPARHDSRTSMSTKPKLQRVTSNLSKGSRDLRLSNDKKGKLEPRNPGRLQSTLRSLLPIVLFISYDCQDGCRSRGTCLHFQFLLCGRAGPDGLICHLCRDSGSEEGYKVARKCRRHNADTTLNRPEDMPANYHQLIQAEKLLTAAWTNGWQDCVHQGHANYAKALALSSADFSYQQDKIRGLASVSDRYSPITPATAGFAMGTETLEYARSSNNKENIEENKPVFLDLNADVFVNSAFDTSAKQQVSCANEDLSWTKLDAATFGHELHAYS